MVLIFEKNIIFLNIKTLIVFTVFSESSLSPCSCAILTVAVQYFLENV